MAEWKLVNNRLGVVPTAHFVVVSRLYGLYVFLYCSSTNDLLSTYNTHYHNTSIITIQSLGDGVMEVIGVTWYIKTLHWQDIYNLWLWLCPFLLTFSLNSLFCNLFYHTHFISLDYPSTFVLTLSELSPPWRMDNSVCLNSLLRMQKSFVKSNVLNILVWNARN